MVMDGQGDLPGVFDCFAEERRIVYVGRLENELTKEDLRRKFISYGTVKLVTLHEKTNG